MAAQTKPSSSWRESRRTRRWCSAVAIDSCYACRRRSLAPCSSEKLDRLASNAAERLGFVLAGQSSRGVRIADVPVRVGSAPADLDDIVEQTGAYSGRHNLFPPEAVEQVMASVRRIVAEYEI